MKKALFVGIAAAVVLVLAGCDGGGIVFPKDQRITFALVINTRVYNGITVKAAVHDHDEDGALLERVQAALESYPNTSTEAWAQLTTLEKLPTNQRYFLDFYLDMDDDGTMNTGDLHGIQVFEVTPSAVWSETKYFYEDLDVVT